MPSLPLPVPAVHLLLRALRWRRPAIGATATGVVLGLMNRAQLHRLDRLHYDRAAVYGSAAHNTSGLFDWEREAVNGWFGGCRSLIVVGAGGGREVLALSRLGFTVTGYECNARLLRAAMELLPMSGCDARVHAIEADAAPGTDGTCDGLIVGWSAYMLMPGRQTRVRFLSDMARLTRSGAPILLSFFTRDGDAPRWRRIVTAAAPLRRLRGAEPVEEGDDLAPNYVHRFTEAEIRDELDAAGFDLVQFSAQGSGPRDSGWGVGRLR